MSFPVLKLGATGSAVRYLQQLLGTNGFGVDVDGIFGPQTENAVRTFQSSRSNTLWPTGVVTAPVWGELGAKESDLPAPTKIVTRTDPVSGMPVELELPKPPLLKATNAGLGAVTVLLYFLGWTNTSAVVGLINVGDIVARQLVPDYAKATAPLMGLSYRR